MRVSRGSASADRPLPSMLLEVNRTFCEVEHTCWFATCPRLSGAPVSRAITATPAREPASRISRQHARPARTATQAVCMDRSGPTGCRPPRSNLVVVVSVGRLTHALSTPSQCWSLVNEHEGLCGASGTVGGRFYQSARRRSSVCTGSARGGS